MVLRVDGSWHGCGYARSLDGSERVIGGSGLQLCGRDGSDGEGVRECWREGHSDDVFYEGGSVDERCFGDIQLWEVIRESGTSFCISLACFGCGWWHSGDIRLIFG